MSTPWAEAWHHALYGPHGFYRRPEGPAGHFATSAQGLGAGGDLLAEALLALARRHGLDHIVDLGAGRGELLRSLHAVGCPSVRLTGLDVVDRPAGLPAGVAWWRSPGGAALPDELSDLQGALVVAHEWLDVVPCPVVREDGGRWRPLTVAPDGTERVWGEVSREEAAWLERWWPLPDVEPDGTPARAEVGLPRDRAWADVVSRVRDGLVLAVDYGHTRATRPHEGTLTAYRSGVQVPLVPDGSCDVTAHVAVDSLGADRLLRQRDALRELLGPVGLPPQEIAGVDPAAYLRALGRASAGRVLSDPAGLGGFWWVLSACGQVDLG